MSSLPWTVEDSSDVGYTEQFNLKRDKRRDEARQLPLPTISAGSRGSSRASSRAGSGDASLGRTGDRGLVRVVSSEEEVSSHHRSPSPRAVSPSAGGVGGVWGAGGLGAAGGMGAAGGVGGAGGMGGMQGTSPSGSSPRPGGYEVAPAYAAAAADLLGERAANAGEVAPGTATGVGARAGGAAGMAGPAAGGKRNAPAFVFLPDVDESTGGTEGHSFSFSQAFAAQGPSAAADRTAEPSSSPSHFPTPHLLHTNFSPPLPLPPPNSSALPRSPVHSPRASSHPVGSPSSSTTYSFSRWGGESTAGAAETGSLKVNSGGGAVHGPVGEMLARVAEVAQRATTDSAAVAASPARDQGVPASLSSSLSPPPPALSPNQVAHASPRNTGAHHHMLPAKPMPPMSATGGAAAGSTGVVDVDEIIKQANNKAIQRPPPSQQPQQNGIFFCC
ncbi:unnamed protein product [Closterium sp. Yama58-4]|nr:unnamed protein product [Closterium sp. Yama58-4]